eukprot:14051168-Alexandrium_andersonii.AAC.1
MPVERQDASARGHVPEPGRPVAGRSQNPRAIGGEGSRPNPAVVPLEGALAMPTGGIPDLGGLVD